ncbi:MAG: serine/threonine-protein kinase, partial [Kofleriaceae bacterium]
MTKVIDDKTVTETPVLAAGGAPSRPAALPIIEREVGERGAEIARGGMGQITEARDARLGRTVALKEIRDPNPALARRFEREALISATLEHPAIVAVYEAGRWPSGEPFYAMKRVIGRPLDQVIAGCATLSDRLALIPNVLAVFDALAYAHGKGIIHRDLKPANVLVGAYGETVVIDWGLAKNLSEADETLAERETDATVMGAVLGTPAYMPPEQARGERVDERADVYALGALLYTVLAGRPPYVGFSTQQILDAVKTRPVTRLRDVPEDLATIVEHAMARDPAER